MSESRPDLVRSPTAPRRNTWQRKVADPIVAQLTQGFTPHKIAITVAVGSAIALFPILGTTTLLCLLVGIVMRLNQPIIQAVNYGCTPLHITFIIYAFRWGERLFGAAHSRLEVRTMMRMLHQHPIDFVTTYSMTALHAIVIWALLVPFWTAAVYYIMLPILRGIDKVRVEAAAAKAATDRANDHPVP